jgi:hypothetical protein
MTNAQEFKGLCAPIFFIQGFHTRFDNEVHGFAMCLPWQQWTETSAMV